MLDWLNNAILTVTDPALGWLLALPATVAIFIVALGTALLMLAIRRFTTDQDLLARCKRDKARLKQLIREARRRDDSEAVAVFGSAVRGALSKAGLTPDAQDARRIEAMLRRMEKRKDIRRFKATIAAIGVKTLWAEVKPLLVALIPIALLATWCLAGWAITRRAGGSRWTWSSTFRPRRPTSSSTSRRPTVSTLRRAGCGRS